MKAITSFFVDAWNELVHKVSWPTFDDLQSSLIVVTIAILITTAMIWLMNTGSEMMMKTIYHTLQ